MIKNAPEELMLRLLDLANRESGLDVFQDELLSHYRTREYREVINQAYSAGRSDELKETWR